MQSEAKDKIGTFAAHLGSQLPPSSSLGPHHSSSAQQPYTNTKHGPAQFSFSAPFPIIAWFVSLHDSAVLHCHFLIHAFYCLAIYIHQCAFHHSVLLPCMVFLFNTFLLPDDSTCSSFPILFVQMLELFHTQLKRQFQARQWCGTCL